MSLKSYALTTVSRTAQFIGLATPASGSTEEIILENLIDQVTEYIHHYIGYQLKQATYTAEEYDGSGGDMLFLRHLPLVSISSFQQRNSAINEDDWDDMESEDYFSDLSGGVITLPARKFIRGRNNYRVTYIAGYDFDNTTTFLTDTEAGDVEYVAWKLIATAWARRKGDAGIERESIGDYSVGYAKEVFESPEIKAILDKYRLVGFGSYQTPRNT